MEINAPAKINLTLEIIGKLDDEYHDLRTVMLKTSMHDKVEINFSRHGMVLTCSKDKIPTDHKNLVIKAINYMKTKYFIGQDFAIHLEKIIPINSGLGGGSSDAASAILAVNKLCSLNLSREELVEVAKNIGADVPFFIYNDASAALATGSGVKIAPFFNKLKFYLLLVMPKYGISTRQCFQNFKFDPDKKDLNKSAIVKNAMKTGNYELFINNLTNDLESSSFELLPVLQEIKTELVSLGFDAIQMTGSGSCIFAITRDLTKAKAIRNAMRNKYGYAFITAID